MHRPPSWAHEKFIFPSSLAVGQRCVISLANGLWMEGMYVSYPVAAVVEMMWK